MPKITGNKGEWSELYVLLELLADGKLYTADDKLKKLEDVYFPILKILRDEEESKKMEYVINDDRKVELHINGQKCKDISRADLRVFAETLYKRITETKSPAFEIDEADGIMSEIECSKIKAPSTDKTDIKMQLQDINTGYKTICGFSIKSELGSAPTLLNASGATNFQFEISGINDNDVNAINAITTKTKILDRVKYIDEHGKLKFVKAKSKGFSENLMFIDSYMDEIIAGSLLFSYRTGAATCKDVVDMLEETNPLGYPKKGLYEYKYKKFLCTIALGMTPSKEWDGKDEANGGYIVVTTSGDVLAYHIYNRDYFEEYLLNNTKFERGSTSKHGFATAYKENGKYYFDMNLQIRFIK
ncbi:MAG: HpaII family restriction endonuclease [Clostridiales bacterium]|nr:HpaII family restriction endonuclease [Clostridiales bacterium]